MRIRDWSSDVCSSDLDHWNIHAPPVEHGRYVGRYRSTSGLLDSLGIADPLVLPFLDGPAGRKIAVHDIMRGGLVGHDIRAHITADHLRQDLRRVAQEPD